MKNSFPKVSVIIPSHNKFGDILGAVRSALAQTWVNLEVIVVDDNSSDGSKEILETIADVRLKTFFVSFSNASKTRNFGLHKATGEFIQFLDADDVLHVEKIELQLRDMKFCNNVLGVCNTSVFSEHITENVNELDTDFLEFSCEPVLFILNLYKSPDKGMVQPNAWLTPRRIIDKAGPWDERLSVDDDGEFFCRVILNSQRIVHTDRVMNFYRRPRTAALSLSQQKSAAAYRSLLDAAILKKNYLIEKLGAEAQLIPVLNSLFSTVMVSAYPLFKEISRQAKLHIDAAAPVAIPVIGGPAVELVKKLFGWKLAKSLKTFVTTRWVVE